MGELTPDDAYYMERALAEARKAEETGDVPVGASRCEPRLAPRYLRFEERCNRSRTAL